MSKPADLDLSQTSSVVKRTLRTRSSHACPRRAMDRPESRSWTMDPRAKCKMARAVFSSLISGAIVIRVYGERLGSAEGNYKLALQQLHVEEMLRKEEDGLWLCASTSEFELTAHLGIGFAQGISWLQSRSLKVYFGGRATEHEDSTSAAAMAAGLLELEQHKTTSQCRQKKKKTNC